MSRLTDLNSFIQGHNRGGGVIGTFNIYKVFYNMLHFESKYIF